jgi:phenylpropionate dioxygenase-like ring-hydroxylating dioxygenase large terminal subunit
MEYDPDSREGSLAKKSRFLDTHYSAYLHRDLPKEDVELTHVGPATPCGEYLRRFWQPVAFSNELKDLPLRVRILGEDLIVFRDRRGQVGVLELHCSHRGASLEFGLVSERGLRCCYHGWLFDVTGQILDMPGEPADSTLKDRLCHGAYPAREASGLVFAYMGPPDRRPELPLYDTLSMPGYRVLPGRKHVLPCNWLQVKENIMDTAHLAFLHTIVSGAQFTEAFGILPQVEWMETPIGMVAVQSRRVGDNVWIRISELMLPNIHQFPPTWETGKEPRLRSRPLMIIWGVPLDDTHTMNIALVFLPDTMEVDAQRFETIKESFGQIDDRPYEERQRVPGDYDAQVGQRPIAIHALEHLASTDRGVIMVRKLLRQGIRDVKRGKDPKGIARTPGAAVPTYSQDTVLRIPAGPDPEADRALLRDVGRKVVDGYYLRDRGHTAE